MSILYSSNRKSLEQYRSHSKNNDSISSRRRFCLAARISHNESTSGVKHACRDGILNGDTPKLVSMNLSNSLIP